MIKTSTSTTTSPLSLIHISAIKDILNDNQPIPVTVERIISEVSRTCNVSPQDIKSKKKSADVSQARQVAIYVIREVTQMPMKNIGEELGGRDHSTIVYSLNAFSYTQLDVYKRQVRGTAVAYTLAPK